MAERVAFIVYVDLAASPGNMHSKESAQNNIRGALETHVSQYNPIVSLAPADLQPQQDTRPDWQKDVDLLGEWYPKETNP